ncbi:hypothetical protein OJF2_20540 [Aquisphaera giovannonii]|uniref:Uncharacterized protein n=1 Tax=Aquisphaera giovannonii TaxID=406548 RepID=A0A5B9VZ05_9BACT|nr:hypothetical protein [Aquisphaera giovannonii]QEH33552.1 hypothetical protein OJF2_20540 [Aquisphaera giovannonii]
MTSRVRVAGFLIASGAMVVALALVAYLAGWAPARIVPAGDLTQVSIRLDAVEGFQKPTTITSEDAGKIAALAAVLRDNRPSQDHKCASTGELVIRTRDGAAVSLGLLPSHDGRSFEFRVPREASYDVVRVDRDAFLKAMADLGATGIYTGRENAR